MLLWRVWYRDTKTIANLAPLCSILSKSLENTHDMDINTQADALPSKNLEVTKSDGVGSDSDGPCQSDVSPMAPRPAGKLDVLIQGVALFSDGYNIQIIGYMNTVLAKLYVVFV
jgi:hypothetical protein